MKFWQKNFRLDWGFSNHFPVRDDRTGSASVQCTKQIILNVESNVSPPIKNFMNHKMTRSNSNIELNVRFWRKASQET